jgi:hypothetical protein
MEEVYYLSSLGMRKKNTRRATQPAPAAMAKALF